MIQVSYDIEKHIAEHQSRKEGSSAHDIYPAASCIINQYRVSIRLISGQNKPLKWFFLF
jgi:hypothetical protein